MSLIKRLFVLSLIFIASACGSSKFSGKGGKKNQDGRDLDPVTCEQTGHCPTAPTCAELAAEDKTAQAAAQNSNASNSGIDCENPAQSGDDTAESPAQNS